MCGVLNGVVVSVLNYQTRGQGSDRDRVDIWFRRFLFTNSAIMSTLSVGRWDGKGERTGHPQPSYAKAKEMDSSTLHTHGCLLS